MSDCTDKMKMLLSVCQVGSVRP